MCNSPIPWTPPGKTTEMHVPCRKCRSCITDAINDHTARGVCEAKSSDWAVTLTLTYRDQPDGSHRRIEKKHFQDAIKRLRAHLGSKHKKQKLNTKSQIRYVVAGEYGELKGRAHFHVCIFGKGLKPDGLTQKERSWPTYFWDKGHVYADWDVDAKSIRYVMKYLHKWQGTETWISRSNGQPLGWDFHLARIDQICADGVFPRDWLYAVPGMKKKGRMSDATRRRFVLTLLDKWCVQMGRAVPWDRLSEPMLNGMRTILNRALRETRDEDAQQTLRELQEKLDNGRRTEDEIEAFLCTLDSAEDFWQGRDRNYGKTEEGQISLSAFWDLYGYPAEPLPEPQPRNRRTGGFDADQVEEIYQAVVGHGGYHFAGVHRKNKDASAKRQAHKRWREACLEAEDEYGLLWKEGYVARSEKYQGFGSD